MSTRLLSCGELAARLGLGESTLRRWRASADFPEPVNGKYSWDAFIRWFLAAQIRVTAARHGPGATVVQVLRDAIELDAGRPSSPEGAPKRP